MEMGIFSQQCVNAAAAAARSCRGVVRVFMLPTNDSQTRRVGDASTLFKAQTDCASFFFFLSFRVLLHSLGEFPLVLLRHPVFIPLPCLHVSIMKDRSFPIPQFLKHTSPMFVYKRGNDALFLWEEDMNGSRICFFRWSA